MEIKSKILKTLIAMGVILNLGLVSYASEQSDKTRLLVEKASQNRNFYNYIMAYIDIIKLPDGQDKAECLDKLATIWSDVNTPKIQKARTMLEAVAKNKDGKTYSETEYYLSNLAEADVDAFTKGYLLGELTSWGKQFVFTEDYTKAVDSLIKIADNNNCYFYNKALLTINKVVNTNSKQYLLGELDNSKKLNKLNIKKVDLNSGIITYENGDQYIGEIKNDLPNGNGIFFSYDGSKFEGQFKEGVLDGVGKVYYRNGVLKFDGEFKEGSLNGTGKIYYTNGKLGYEGQLANDVANGKGKSYDDTGNIINEGSYKNDKLDGHGIVYYSNGSIEYQGSFKAGIRSGQGTLNLEDGGKYEGEFDNGIPNGQGVYHLADGKIYRGGFKDGRFHGQGILILVDESKYEGEYKDGYLNGQAKCTLASGTIFEGTYKNGVLNGQGKAIFSNGNKYEGEFENGLPNGNGTYTKANGDVYVGEFKGGKYNGQGTYTFASGKVVQGTWQDDKYIGN